jgi:Domain of unknown function (DUF1735)/Domain of unknown function (DUF4361)
MKSVSKYSMLAGLASALLLLASCLKESKGFLDIKNDAQRAVIEMPAGANEINSIALDVLPQPQDVNLVEVRVASVSTVDRAYPVKLRLNPTLISDYNALHGTAYTEAPPAAIVISSLSLVVPAGERSAFLKVKVDAGALLGGSYALGFSIADAGDAIISENFKNVLVAVIAKNKYDGVYRVRGRVIHPNAALTGPYPEDEWDLVTTGQFTVRLEPGQPVASNGQLTYFSTVIPAFTVNEPANTVSVTQGGGTVTPEIPAGTSNTYDPAAKTFYIYYEWSGGTRRAWDTCTYVRPRS